MSLEKKASWGLIWNLVQTFATKIIMLATNIWLARILGPKDFGLIGILVAIVTIGNTLIEAGLGSSLVRSRQIDQSDLNVVFFLNLFFSLFLYCCSYFLAPWLSIYYNTPILSTLFRAYSWIFIINGLTIVQRSIYARNLNFKQLTILKVSAAIISSIIALLMVNLGYGIWSLILFHLVCQGVETIGLWLLSSWRPSFSFDKSKLKKHLQFGLNLSLNQLMSGVLREVNALIIGKYFSVVSLGLYTQAKKLSLFPVESLNMVISKTTFPYLSQIQEDKLKVSRVYRSILTSLFFAATGCLLGLGVIADPLIYIILGEEWVESAPLFKILMFSALLIPVHAFNLNVFLVYGRSDLLLRLGFIKNVMSLIAIFIGIQFGIEGLLISFTINSYLALGINSYYSKNLINYSSKAQLKDMLPTFICGVTSFIISGFVQTKLALDSHFLQASVLGFSYALLYTLLSISINRKNTWLILTTFSKVKGLLAHKQAVKF